MEQYLKEKYGKEFVVEKVKYYHEYLGAPKEIKGIAYPGDDKELKFDIRKFADGHMWVSKSSYVPYNERYLWLLWVKQAKKRIFNLTKNDMFDVEMIFPKDDIVSLLHGKTIDLDEAKKLSKDKISMRVKYALFYEDEYTEKVLLNQVLSIITVCKDEDFCEISLRVVCFDKSYKSKLKSEFNKYMNSADPLYKKRKMQNEIKIEYFIPDINVVKTQDDINEYVVR
jgi:hypothetical protein